MHTFEFGREDLQRLGLINDPNDEPHIGYIEMYLPQNTSLEGLLGFHGYDQINQVNLIELPNDIEVHLHGQNGGSAFIRTHDNEWEVISQPTTWGGRDGYGHTRFMIPLLPPYVTLEFTEEQYKTFLGSGDVLSVVTYHKMEEYPIDYKRLIPLYDHPDTLGFVPYVGDGFKFKVLFGTVFGFVNHLGFIPGTLARVTATGFEPLEDSERENYPIDARNGVVNVIPDYSNQDGRRFAYPRKDPAQYWMIKRKDVKPQYVASVKAEPFETILIQAPIGAVILIREAYDQKALMVRKDATIEVDPAIYLDDPRFELFPIPA